MELVIFMFAFVLVLFRVLGYKTMFYQAIAHLFVGSLFGAWGISKYYKYSKDFFPSYCFYLAWALSIVELMAFMLEHN